jgi:predicted permease
MLKELKSAIRRMSKSPGFTVTALLTFAICLGANVALFAVVNAVIIRPLPYSNSEQLVSVFNRYPKAGINRTGVSVAQYLQRRNGVESFADSACYMDWGFTLGSGGLPDHVESTIVTPSFFHVLGVPAALGRTFADEEGFQGKNDVVIISDGLWRQRFAADPGIIGRKIQLNTTSQVIVGVMPPGFSFGASNAQLWIPMAFSNEDRTIERHETSRSMIARLRPGATIAEAQSQVDAQNSRGNPMVQDPLGKFAKEAGFQTSVVDLHGDLIGQTRSTLLLLQAGGLFLLLIGAVNLANLFMVRASIRSKEFSIRQALGAGQARLAQMLIAETLVLSFAGGVLGLGLCWSGLRGLQSLGINQLPHFSAYRLDAVVCAVAIAASVLMGLLMAAPTLWHIFNGGLVSGLSVESRSGTTTRSAQRLRLTLIAAQFALAFTLLTGAGMLAQSFSKILSVDPGFHPENVLTGSISLPWKHYEQAAQRYAFVARLGQELHAQPGAISVGFTSNLPFSGDNHSSNAFVIEGRPPLPGQSLITHNFAGVTGDFFAALGIPLREGRVLTEDDSSHLLRVCVVDEDFAKHYWPGKSALGHRISNMPGVLCTIVGVVGATKQGDLVERQTTGSVYFPFTIESGARVTAVIRTALSPQSEAPAFRNAVQRVDPDLAVEDLKTMTARIDDSLEPRRSPLMLAGIFASFALVLAAVGLYGVLAYAVSQRRREIGVRLALGAQPRQIFMQFISIGARLVIVGSMLGCIGGWMIGRAMAGLLYGVGSDDPIVYFGIAALLALVALAACIVPAINAARVPPMEALRAE